MEGEPFQRRVTGLGPSPERHGRPRLVLYMLPGGAINFTE